MEMLLTAIALWLSANFDLPPAASNPRIEFASPLKMAAMRYRGLASDRQPVRTDAADTIALARNTVSIFDAERGIIYLPDGWTGTTPAELSVLVHEMVHHLQFASGATFECPQARERTAFDAQERWLAMFGKTLSDEFDIDPLARLVRTSCLN